MLLCLETVFADVIRLRSHQIRMGPNPMTGVTEEDNWDTDTHTGETGRTPRDDSRRGGGVHLQVKKCQGLHTGSHLKEGRREEGTRSPSDPPEGTHPANTWISNCWCPERLEVNFHCFRPFEFVVNYQP